MKTHYQPLTAPQLYHILQNYQLPGKLLPPIWNPPPDELAAFEKDGTIKTLLHYLVISVMVTFLDYLYNVADLL